MNWYTAPESGPELDRLLTAWPDAPVEQLEVLGMMLGVARDQVLAYAPANPPATENPPARYVLAQLRQTQSIWDAGEVDVTGEIGDGAYRFTPRPMDKTIQRMIRPRDGKPHVL